MRIKGVNKFGIKLEDYSDYDAYKKALIKVKLQIYGKTKKYKLLKSKYQQTKKWKLYLKKYAQSEKGSKIRNAMGAKRRAAKLQRTPAWADLEAIKQFYINCPKGYAVDHIVPLQGVNVSGLHVLNNLQYLTKSENCSKGNKYDV